MIFFTDRKSVLEENLPLQSTIEKLESKKCYSNTFTQSDNNQFALKTVIVPNFPEFPIFSKFPPPEYYSYQGWKEPPGY